MAWKDSVAAIGANGESLGVVLECIRRGLDALVGDLYLLVVLNQHEGGVGAVSLNRAGFNVTRNAQMAGVSLVTQALQLLNGDVVTLVGLNAADR